MNNQKPFEFVFTQLSPEKFADIFHWEDPQTNAFILSFAEDEEYIKAVLNNYPDDDATLVKEGIKYIDFFDMDFLKKVEGWVREMINEELPFIEIRKRFFVDEEENVEEENV
jgi:flagellar motor switch protein FliG